MESRDSYAPQSALRSPLQFLTSRFCPPRVAVRLAPPMPGHIRRMPISSLMDDRGRDDAGEREQQYSGRNPPSTIRVRGYVTIDVLHP